MYKDVWQKAYLMYDANKHLEIHNLPICGKLQNFKEKLEEIGYIFSHESDHQICMKKQFNNREISVFVCSTSVSDLVGFVILRTIVEDWIEAKQVYEEFKKILIGKYGQPTEVLEKFDEPYEEGDGYELDALQQNMAIFCSHFNLPEGRISIGINNNDVEDEDSGEYDNETEVSITFFDNCNMKLLDIEDDMVEDERG